MNKNLHHSLRTRSAAPLALVLIVAGVLAPPAAFAQPQAPPDPAASAVIELIDFRGLPLSEALRLLAEQTGLNLVPSTEAADVEVSLHLRNVSAAAAIDTLARTHDLYHKRDDTSGVISFHTTQEYRKELSSFREDETKVFTLLYPNALDVATAIRDLYGDRVRLSLGVRDDEQTDELQERFDRFDILSERSQGLGIFTGGTGVGLAGGGRGTELSSRDRQDSERFTRRSDLLRQFRDGGVEGRRRTEPQYVEDLTPDEIQQLESALRSDAERDRQIVADLLRRREATIFVTVVRRHNQVIVRSSDDQTMQQIESLVQRLDVPTPLVLLEVKIMAIDLDDGFRSAFDFQFQAGESAGGFTSGDILPPVGELAPPDAAPAVLNSIGLAGSELIPGALAFQYVGNQFRARMQLLEDQNRVTLLATPLLLTANNEVSRLFVGEEVPLNRGFTGSQTIVGEATVVTPGSTTIEFRPVGTTLLLTPNINADRTVTLRILQEVSSISPTPATVLVPTATGFVEQDIDVVQARTVSGTIVAKDGLAVALGGLIEEQLSSAEQKVPVLGELPVLGILFRRENTLRSRRELVIMIRPYVLNTPAESDRISRQLLEELSMHPNAPEARGTLGTHEPHEVLRPQSEQQRIRRYFRFHSITPEDLE